MTAQSLYLFQLISLAVVFSIPLVILCVFYAKTLKKYHELSMEQQNMRSTTNKKTSELLDTSRQKADQIIEKAQRKALELIENAKLYDEETKKELIAQLEDARKAQSEEFKKISAEFLTDYEKALAGIKTETTADLGEVTKKIQSDALSQVEDLSHVIEKETVGAEKVVEQKIEEEYAKARQEIEEYKKKKFATIDASVYPILRKVAEEILSKSLTFEDQQQLVLDALAQSKKEFNAV